MRWLLKLVARGWQEEGVAQGLVEELDWYVLVSALHSKEAAAVMDFVHRYGLGIDSGNALLMLLQQVLNIVMLYSSVLCVYIT